MDFEDKLWWIAFKLFKEAFEAAFITMQLQLDIKHGKVDKEKVQRYLDDPEGFLKEREARK